MLHILLFLVAALALGAVPHDGVPSGGLCPLESNRAAEVMTWFLQTTDESSYKSKVGLTTVGPGDARLLRSETDAAACQTLNGVFANTIASELDGQRTDDLAYYDLGGRYVAVTTFRTLIGSEFTMIGLEAIDTFDRSFTHLGGLGF